MDIIDTPETLDVPLQISIDGITFYFWTELAGTKNEDLESYASAQIDFENGSRLSGSGLTVHFFPTGNPADDTTIGKRVNVEKGVVIGPGCHIGEGAIIGHDVTIERDCEIGKYSTVFSGTYIGEGNYIPDFAFVEEGPSGRLDIDPFLLTRENVEMMDRITPDLILNLRAIRDTELASQELSFDTR